MSERSISLVSQPIDEGEESGVDDVASLLTSNCSVLPEAEDYVIENGRMYHADWIPSRYLLPNDNQEQDRLKFQHLILLQIVGLHNAPLPKGLQSVLDVGTGTGKWAIIFVDAYPSAILTALDISANVMPTSTHPNCTFYLEDVEGDFALDCHNKFDYVHIRLLHGVHDWHRFITKVFEALAPGGYIEVKEFEFPLEFHIQIWQKTPH
jgi:SAM-dependent methyltransferase